MQCTYCAKIASLSSATVLNGILPTDTEDRPDGVLSTFYQPQVKLLSPSGSLYSWPLWHDERGSRDLVISWLRGAPKTDSGGEGQHHRSLQHHFSIMASTEDVEFQGWNGRLSLKQEVNHHLQVPSIQTSSCTLHRQPFFQTFDSPIIGAYYILLLRSLQSTEEQRVLGNCLRVCI